ncbi:YggT family protein [Helicobacter sp. WB40]|uniref:YggT family protein n=1 Tax=Helicobacter sp. WB40 TaxID=3004130 RepID=UPI0022EBA98F|nr:YggT family protein [Helicobacter sp. WB40]MDA3967404.1 YggT family protein [Helicobacter sp. WB40]
MVLSTLIDAIAQILSMIINIYVWIVIISAFVSWFRVDPYNPIVQILYKLTEPVYAMLRRFVPTTISNVDIAPIIVILVLKFIDLFLVRLLFHLSSSF